MTRPCTYLPSMPEPHPSHRTGVSFLPARRDASHPRPPPSRKTRHLSELPDATQRTSDIPPVVQDHASRVLRPGARGCSRIALLRRISRAEFQARRYKMHPHRPWSINRANTAHGNSDPRAEPLRSASPITGAPLHSGTRQLYPSGGGRRVPPLRSAPPRQGLPSPHHRP